MKIFLDTANIKELETAKSWGLLDGVTTNPTLISKEGYTDFESAIKKICEIAYPGEVSAEVISTDEIGMFEEALKISNWAENVVIKIPITETGLKITKKIKTEQPKIKINVTLVFSLNQAILAAKVDADYVSPFVGRLDDVAEDGMGLIKDILSAYRNYNFTTQVIVASVRHPRHIFTSAQLGAPIVTVPFNVLKQMFNHPLTDIGIKRFLEDWKKLGPIKI